MPEFRKQFLSHADEHCKCKSFQIYPITNHYEKRPMPRKGVKYSKTPKGEGNSAIFLVDLPSKCRCTEFLLPLIWCSPFIAVKPDRNLVDEALTSQCSRIFSRETSSFTFTWQRSAPVYHGGFDTFLWERYSKPPSSDYAEIFYQDDHTPNQPQRVLMTISTTPASSRCLLQHSGTLSGLNGILCLTNACVDQLQ